MTQADDVLARLRLRATLTEAAETGTAGLPRHRGVADAGAHLGLGPHGGAVVGPGGVRRLLARAKISPKAALGAGLAVVLLLVVVVFWRSGDQAAGQASGLVVTASPTAGGAAELAPSATPLSEPGSQVVLAYVVGAVMAPGVVELPAGARVIDALTKAGGALPEADLAVLNLAAVVVDGERIYVPEPGETPPAVISGGVVGGAGPAESGQAGSGAGVNGSELVNVNTASAEQLTVLPGIGPVLAGRIVDFRTSHGPYSDLADLSQVSGIGPKLTASLEDRVTF